MSAPRVRAMTMADLEQVLAWRNHPDVCRYMYTQHEIGLAEHRRWFESASQSPDKHLLVFEAAGMPLGFIHFSRLRAPGVADWGFYVAPDAPKGSGRQLGRAALDHAFQQLGLHKICGQALAFNQRSINFHLSMGFQQEGVLRDQHFDGASYHAIVCFGLLKHEWAAHQGERGI